MVDTPRRKRKYADKAKTSNCAFNRSNRSENSTPSLPHHIVQRHALCHGLAPPRGVIHGPCNDAKILPELIQRIPERFELFPGPTIHRILEQGGEEQRLRFLSGQCRVGLRSTRSAGVPASRSAARFWTRCGFPHAGQDAWAHRPELERLLSIPIARCLRSGLAEELRHDGLVLLPNPRRLLRRQGEVDTVPFSRLVRREERVEPGSGWLPQASPSIQLEWG